MNAPEPGRRPDCPPWCTAGHDRGISAVHQATTGRLILGPDKDTPAAEYPAPGAGVQYTSITAGLTQVAEYDQAPSVGISAHAVRLDEDPASVWLALDPEHAAALAAVIDLLRAATPGQHAELAGYIRQAAGTITDGSRNATGSEAPGLPGDRARA